MKTQKQRSILPILYLSLAFLLTVIGCGTDSNSDPVAPLANAGPDQKITIGEIATLDGSASRDPDGNDLAFQWSIVDKPAASSAVIVGTTSPATEFLLDKAGVYTIELAVSNGDSSATDQVVITNRTPVIGGVSVNNADRLDFLEDAGKALRGDRIFIHGEFFSADLTENRVTIDGEACEITSVNATGLNIIVPDSVTSGDLVVTVGEESVIAPDPVKVVILPIHQRFREVVYNVGGAEAISLSNDGFTSGFLFKVTASGRITHLGLQTRISTVRKVTVWDADSTAILGSTDINDIGTRSFTYSALSEPISLQQGVTYAIGVRVPQGEFRPFVSSSGGTPFLYPVEGNGITVESEASGFGDSIPKGRGFSQIVGIPDLIFETD